MQCPITVLLGCCFLGHVVGQPELDFMNKTWNTGVFAPDNVRNFLEWKYSNLFFEDCEKWADTFAWGSDQPGASEKDRLSHNIDIVLIVKISLISLDGRVSAYRNRMRSTFLDSGSQESSTKVRTAPVQPSHAVCRVRGASGVRLKSTSGSATVPCTVT